MQEMQVLKSYQVIQVYLSLVVERSSWTTFREQHMPKVTVFVSQKSVLVYMYKSSIDDQTVETVLISIFKSSKQKLHWTWII